MIHGTDQPGFRCITHLPLDNCGKCNQLVPVQVRGRSLLQQSRHYLLVMLYQRGQHRPRLLATEKAISLREEITLQVVTPQLQFRCETAVVDQLHQEGGIQLQLPRQNTGYPRSRQSLRQGHLAELVAATPEQLHECPGGKGVWYLVQPGAEFAVDTTQAGS